MANQTSVTLLLADYYSNRYQAWDAIGELHVVILKHSDKKYFTYHTIIKEVGEILKDNNNSLYCEINKIVNKFLFDDLHTDLNIDLIRYRKNNQNKVIIKMKVYV